MDGDADKAALIAELAAARARITESGRTLEEAGSALKEKLNLPSRIKASYERHKPAWLGAAALFGFLLSRIPARKKVVYVERSTGRTLGPAGKASALWAAVKMAATFAKPFLSELATQRLGALAQRFVQRGGPPSDSDAENDSDGFGQA
jgi:hypothetical protein